MKKIIKRINDYEFIITGKGRITIYFFNQCTAQFQPSELTELQEILDIAKQLKNEN